MEIKSLIAKAHETAKSKGFWETPSPKSEKIALMHSELSEMLEAVRDPTNPPDRHCPKFSNEIIELADLVIRAADYAGGYGLPLAEAIEAKMAYNASRPHRHGKTF